MESLQHAFVTLNSIKSMCDTAQYILKGNNTDIVKNDFNFIFEQIKDVTLKSMFNMERDQLLERLTKFYVQNESDRKEIFPNMTDFSERNVRTNVNVMIENIMYGSNLDVDKFIPKEAYIYHKDDEAETEKVNETIPKETVPNTVPNTLPNTVSNTVKETTRKIPIWEEPNMTSEQNYNEKVKMLRKLAYYRDYGYRIPYLTLDNDYNVIKYELEKIEYHISKKQEEYNKQREQEKAQYMSFLNMLNTLYTGGNKTEQKEREPLVNGLGDFFDTINRFK